MAPFIKLYGKMKGLTASAPAIPTDLSADHLDSIKAAIPTESRVCSRASR